MKIAMLIPGSGDNFYCENCYRDGALYQALRKLGEDVLAIPLYLPPQIEEQTSGKFQEIFFGGINVYLQQKYPFFRRTPRWLDRLLDSPRLLAWVAKKAGMTDAVTLAQTTLSMLRGEQGHQIKELDRLVDWLAEQEKPNVVCLSDYLLAGLVGRLRQRLGVPVVCLLQDEDEFLDELPEPYRSEAWDLLRNYVAQVDLFIAASEFYAQAMSRRLHIPPEKMAVVYNGISPEKYPKLENCGLRIADCGLEEKNPKSAIHNPQFPIIGYLSRMSAPKGLDLLAEAFIHLKQNSTTANVKLHIDGGMTAMDAEFVNGVRGKLAAAGVAGDVQFTHFLPEKRVEFLRGLSVLCVPERRASAGGYYVLEALACGVPAVQPASGVFPELKSRLGCGITLFEPADAGALARQLSGILLKSDPQEARGPALQAAVFQQFNVVQQAQALVELLKKFVG